MPTKITPAPLTRPLYEIAREINGDHEAKGKPIHFSAVPYVRVLGLMKDLDSRYGFDSAEDIVIRLLGNLATWRGETATRVKAELRAGLAHHQEQRSRAHHPAGRRRTVSELQAARRGR